LLWLDLIRVAGPGYMAAPASLLPFTAWQRGNGALASIALDRARADDPGYSMATLLREVFDAGIHPRRAISPLTPQAVAIAFQAHYDELDAGATAPAR
jgi:hypothetical protein